MKAKAELLQIHAMMQCVADVTEDTPAEGYTANAVKQYVISQNNVAKCR